MLEQMTVAALVAAGALVSAVALPVFRQRTLRARPYAPWWELVARPIPEAGQRARFRDHSE